MRACFHVNCECFVQYLIAGGAAVAAVVVAGMLLMPARKCTRVVRSDEVNIRNERRVEVAQHTYYMCVCVCECKLVSTHSLSECVQTSIVHTNVLCIKCTKSKTFHQTFSSSSSLKHSSSDVQTIHTTSSPPPRRLAQSA